jgi:PTS system nitrogen regulatory IIA component
MMLAELLPEHHVFAALRAADKPRLLAELARRAGTALGLPHAEIAAALTAREALVEFAAVDGRPVDLVFVLLGPPAARAEHLAALAAATRRLRDPAVAAALRRSDDPATLRERFLGAD